MVGREIFRMKLVIVYHELLELVRSVCFKYTERMKWTELDVQGTGKTAASISDEIGRHGVLCSATDEFDVRMVTHCDVDRAGIDAAIAAVAAVVGQPTSASARI